MSTKRLQFLLFFILLSAAGLKGIHAQDPGSSTSGIDTLGFPVAGTDSIARAFPDSLYSPGYDTLPFRPTLSASDTLHDAGSKQAVDSPVTYNAQDSIIYSMAEQKVYLYGGAHIEYREIQLDADYIEFNMGNEAVFATYVYDSLGNEIGKPEFSEGSESFQARKISYNFRTKKGIITDIFTEQEGGFLHSETTKRHPNDHIHMRHGKYTTCDAPHPHFYIALSRAKSIPGDKIISGPAYIVLEDVPLPIGIPFGFFPSNQINQSGFLLPTYGEEERRGFYLRNGGFYFAISQYFDLALTGDIYTNGTWGLRGRTNYKRNYKFNGTFGFNYFENISGEKGLENYSKTRDISIRWSHNQDSRANPNQTFRASVDFSTRAYDQNHQRNINNVLRSTKRSSVSYSRIWPNSPFNFSASADVTQNSQTGTLDMNLPSANLNMNRLYPLKRKKATGSPRFYEKLSISYSASLANKLHANEDAFFENTSFQDFDNAYQHSIPVSLPVNFLNYFTLSPSMRYSGVFFSNAIKPQFIDGASNPSGSMRDTLIIDTIPGLHYAHAIVPSVGLSVTPKIYGMYTFREKSRIEAIRHVMSPSASLSFVPDMSAMSDRYYQEVQIDTLGRTRVYSKFDQSIYRTPVPSGRSGNVGLNLKNNVEMKLKPKSDTSSETTKVKILDNLNFSTSYNIFKDSLKWAPIRMTGNTALFNRKLSLRFGGSFQPYSYQVNENGRYTTVDKAYYTTHKKLARMTSFDFSVGTRFSSQQGKKEGAEGEQDLANDPTSRIIDPTGLDQMAFSNYVDFEIPWTLSMDYNFRYSRPYDEHDIIQSFRIRGDVSLTPKWKIGFNSGYDFKTKKVTTTNMSIHRDLHCWEMQVSMVPFGRYRSYSFQINIKSAILRDLMYEKGDTWYDNF